MEVVNNPKSSTFDFNDWFDFYDNERCISFSEI